MQRNMVYFREWRKRGPTLYDIFKIGNSLRFVNKVTALYIEHCPKTKYRDK